MKGKAEKKITLYSSKLDFNLVTNGSQTHNVINTFFFIVENCLNVIMNYEKKNGIIWASLSFVRENQNFDSNHVPDESNWIIVIVHCTQPDTHTQTHSQCTKWILFFVRFTQIQ